MIARSRAGDEKRAWRLSRRLPGRAAAARRRKGHQELLARTPQLQLDTRIAGVGRRGGREAQKPFVAGVIRARLEAARRRGLTAPGRLPRRPSSGLPDETLEVCGSPRAVAVRVGASELGLPRRPASPQPRQQGPAGRRSRCDRKPPRRRSACRRATHRRARTHVAPPAEGMGGGSRLKQP